MRDHAINGIVAMNWNCIHVQIRHSSCKIVPASVTKQLRTYVALSDVRDDDINGLALKWNC